MNRLDKCTLYIGGGPRFYPIPSRIYAVSPSDDRKLDLEGRTPIRPQQPNGTPVGAQHGLADVYAIGHPLGFSWTFTQGVVSSIRPVQNETQNYTAVQTQTPINPGNSGGPLLSANLEVVGINTWGRDISTVKKAEVEGVQAVIARPAQGLNFAVSARDIRQFFDDAATGKVAVLSLQVPESPEGCKWQMLFNGRNKANNAGLKTFSSKCDGVADAWEVFPDDKSKPVELYIDRNRSGKSSIVILTNAKTGKWEKSFWDFFRDETFAVVGHHDDGSIKPSRFEFAKT